MTIHRLRLAWASCVVLLLLQLTTLCVAQTTRDGTAKKEQDSIPGVLTAGRMPALPGMPVPQGVSVLPGAPGPDKGPNQIEQLSKRVEQLEALIERQNQTLIEMQRQLAEVRKDQTTSASIRQANASLTTEAPAGQEKKAQPEAASAVQGQAQKSAGILAGWDGNHAFLRSADGDFETVLTGYAQLDFRGYQQGNHPANTFLLRRARLALEGKLFRYFDYKVEGDFADTTSTLARDIYLRVHRVDRVQLTFGQFREPFSQEELRPDSVQDFVERSLANNLAPSRSPGVMLSGILKKGVFEYQLGAFNGKGLLANNTVGTPEGVVRVRVAPWKSTKDYWTKGLMFGGAYALGRNSTTAQSVRGLTESRSFAFFNPDTVNGAVTRANGELTWLVGPASFRAEYDQVNQARNHLGSGGRNLPGVVARGYMGQFTYLLTGEVKGDVNVVVPKHNLFGDESGGGSGAWELKVRYSGLQISDGTAKSNRARTVFFGANWYLNRFVRYVFDYGIELYQDPLRTPRPGDRSFHVVLSRIQVAF